MAVEACVYVCVPSTCHNEVGQDACSDACSNPLSAEKLIRFLVVFAKSQNMGSQNMGFNPMIVTTVVTSALSVASALPTPHME